MKTFFDLKQEVREVGKCHGCGGCVTFCAAVNYGALQMGEDHLPYYKNADKCIDCGICYQICPAVHSEDEAIKRQIGWSAPAGKILGVHSARVRDRHIRSLATDGGVVTGMLLHLFDKGHIDGAIVTQPTNSGRKPCLATTRNEIIHSAGISFDIVGSMAHFGDTYSTYSPSIQAMGDLMRNGLRRIAFVGTPCQIKSVRKMQALKIVPSDAVKFCFGLFCSGNYILDAEKLAAMPELSGKKLADVDKMNIKDDFILHFKDEETACISLEKMQSFKRQGCRFCTEFSAEYADISFGGVGSEQGWTTVVTRTALGRAAFADALDTAIERKSIDERGNCSDIAMEAVLKHAKAKQAIANGDFMRKSG